MISYELYCQIRFLHQERGLNFAQIARELHLDEETVAKWARAKSYTIARSNMQRKSKLEPYKVLIQRAGWNGIPILPLKSSSGSVPRKATPAGSPSSPIMCARSAGCVRQPS